MEKNKKLENDTLYTRCPTCTTAFKVTEELLSAASGKVRCGACLAIFQATDYMLKRSERNTQAASPTTEQPSNTLISETANLSKELAPELQASQTQSNTNDFEPKLDFQETQTTPEDSFETEPQVSDDSVTDPVVDIDVITDVEQGDLSSIEFPFDEEFESSDNESKQPAEKAVESVNTIESDDARPNNDGRTEFETKDVSTEQVDFDNDEPFTAKDSFSDAEVDDLSDQLAEQMQETDADLDPLDEFEDIVEEKNTDLRRNIMIAAIAIFSMISLQQVWSNRQALAWSESWGGTTKSLCQYLPCNLKDRRDVSKIKLLQRQLSPDEENENQLDIKVLLTNDATFDQPYPTIKIAFSNKNGERVSIKSFPPDYYLQPDSVNKLMPYGTEVHIHFKTELTHPDALGFEFIFE